MEFTEEVAQEKDIREAMTMPGGGPLSVDSGQVTDDSEMAHCLMQAIIESNEQGQEEKVFNADVVAKWYGKWVHSDPFDIGNATESALGCLKDYEKARWYKAKTEAEKWNKTTKSNGSLMRIMPLAVWASNLKDAELKKVTVADTQLVHANTIVHQTIFVWCAGVKSLLKADPQVLTI